MGIPSRIRATPRQWMRARSPLTATQPSIAPTRARVMLVGMPIRHESRTTLTEDNVMRTWSSSPWPRRSITFVPTVWATAVPITSGPATLNRSSAAATRGVMRRPEVNDAIRLPPSLKPETRPNKPAAASGATAARLTTRGRRSRLSRLGKSDDLSAIVDVDPGRRGIGRQAGHCAHVAADRVDEAGTDRRAHLSHGQHPTGRSALEGRVRRDRQMSLGDAHRQPAEAVALIRIDLARGVDVVLDAACSIHAPRHRFELFLERGVIGIEEVEGVGLRRRLGHGLGQLDRSLSPLCEVVADGRPNSNLVRQLAD